MKIHEIEISKVRGIKNVKLTPNGENLVLWGPNGSGKSAVVDAIDFLLTGKISRLVGEGTAGLSLKAHGPHVDHQPSQAIVDGRIEIPSGDGLLIRITRKMSAPSKLECEEEERKLLEPTLQVAQKGQHVLSRREILKYVAAEAGKRAVEVQTLLNLREIEEIRRVLGKTTNIGKQRSQDAKGRLEAARLTIAGTLGLKSFQEKEILAAVNGCRKVLGGADLSLLKSDQVKTGVSASPEKSRLEVNPKRLVRDIESVQTNLASFVENVSGPFERIEGLLKELSKDKAGVEGTRKLKLWQDGLDLIGPDGACPLCGTQWAPDELRKHVEEHIRKAEGLRKRMDMVLKDSQELREDLSRVQLTLQAILEGTKKSDPARETGLLSAWSKEVEGLTEFLDDPIGKYLKADGLRPKKPQVPAGLAETLKVLKESFEELAGKVSPEQDSWDTLTRLEENLKAYEMVLQEESAAQKAYERAKAIERHFQDARDGVLATLYSGIENRFSELYAYIHAEDESTFSGSLRPEGAGLVFEVDFYNRGKFPPLALHSEGHQDSMGLCLYLALAEKLTKNTIQLTILDDVVMSVDAGHRRKVCSMLAEKFPGRQFIITTHDRTWARQLVSTGVVKRRNSIEFCRWSVETGPFMATEVDLWDKIQADIDGNDIPSAAARLRRGGEEFFEFASNGLCGSVIYRTDGRWDLGDFVSAAIGAYRKRLNEAKVAAQSWGNEENFEKLQELGTVAQQVIDRSQVEQWAINENVHYNRWGEFQPEDFIPVVEAWRDLFGLFQCVGCKSVFFLEEKDGKPSSLRCTCGKVNWNLLKKKQSD